MRMLEKCSGFDCVLNGRKKAWSSSANSDGQPNLDNTGKPVAGKCFCRPIGQYIIADVLQSVGIQGKSIEDALTQLWTTSLWTLSNLLGGVIWNPTTQRIIGGKSERH